jgi:hypothetical protein
VAQGMLGRRFRHCGDSALTKGLGKGINGLWHYRAHENHKKVFRNLTNALRGGKT